MHCSKRRIYVADPHFDPISNKAMTEFLVFDNTNSKEWKEDIWDCDDFSLQFKAAAQRYFAIRNLNPAVGIIWTDKHAFNFYLNKNREVHYLEPSTDAKTFLTDRVKLVVI
jgi:hypothetical protein